MNVTYLQIAELIVIYICNLERHDLSSHCASIPLQSNDDDKLVKTMFPPFTSHARDHTERHTGNACKNNVVRRQQFGCDVDSDCPVKEICSNTVSIANSITDCGINVVRMLVLNRLLGVLSMHLMQLNTIMLKYLSILRSCCPEDQFRPNMWTEIISSIDYHQLLLVRVLSL